MKLSRIPYGLINRCSLCGTFLRPARKSLLRYAPISPNSSDSSDSDYQSWRADPWTDRIQEPILLQQSIKHGIPIPQISLANVGKESLVGRRTENEDRIVVKALDTDLLMFGIFDGHGGALAVDYCAEFLSDHISFWLPQDHNLQFVLRNAFMDINNKFAKYMYDSRQIDSPMENTGTTATVCLLRNGNELVVASVGDSRAVICRNGRALRLSIDHDPDSNIEERERIIKNKGYVSWNSLGRPLVNGVLAMTRSIGDLKLKRYGVTAEPTTRSIKVKHARDSFLLMVTDGVHFVMTDQEMCNSISQFHTPSESATFLVDQALQFGSDDNVSAIVVPFGQWGRINDSGFATTLRWKGRSG